MPESTIEVTAAVIVQDGQYLITRRLDESHQGGLWEFPGGKRENNESLKDCLRREIKEELDLEIEVGVLLKTIHYAYAFYTFTLHFYLCRIQSGTPRLLGCQDFRWVKPHELGYYPFPPANHAIIAQLTNPQEEITSES